MLQDVVRERDSYDAPVTRNLPLLSEVAGAITRSLISARLGSNRENARKYAFPRIRHAAVISFGGNAAKRCHVWEPATRSLWSFWRRAGAAIEISNATTARNPYRASVLTRMA
jgi:hypothetical protein